MKLIDSSVEFLGEVPTSIPAALRFIERVTRTCYKSENKITPTSALPFIKSRLLKPNPKHTAMLEHSNFVVKIRNTGPLSDKIIDDLTRPEGKHLRYHIQRSTIPGEPATVYIGGNYTAWYNLTKHVRRDDFVGLVPEYYRPFLEIFAEIFGYTLYGKNVSEIEPNYYSAVVCHEEEIPSALRRYSAKFICDTGVSHELVRHRNHSYAQESTRYCDYTNLGIQFIRPADYARWGLAARWALYLGLVGCAISYKVLRFLGLAPQKARAVLPKALKTEVYATGYLSDWKHLLKLRTGAGAHPDFRKLAIILKTQMMREGVM